MAMIRRKKDSARVDDKIDSITEAQNQMSLLERSNGNSGNDGRDSRRHEGAQNGNGSGNRAPAAARSRKRTAKRKVRVELIKNGDEPHGAEMDTSGQAVGADEREAMATSSETGQKVDAGMARDSSATQSRNQSQNTGIDGGNRLNIHDLTQMGISDLRELASTMGIGHEAMISMKKQEIIYSILKAHTEKRGVIFASGSLEESESSLFLDIGNTQAGQLNNYPVFALLLDIRLSYPQRINPIEDNRYYPINDLSLIAWFHSR